MPGKPVSISRRQALGAAGALGLGAALFGTMWYFRIPPVRSRNPLAYLAPHVKRAERWGPAQLNDFLSALQEAEMLSCLKAAQVQPLPNMSGNVDALQRQLLWEASHAVTYIFRDQKSIQYHDLVAWCAKDAGIGPAEIQRLSTFDLERRLMEQQFSSIWDGLSESQRKDLLAKIDPDNSIKDAAGIASLGGAGALAALGTTAYFTGFAFYTTMSVVICTVAGWVNVTLPFAAYMTASSTVAILAGPFGWAAMTVAAGLGVALLGSADARQTSYIVFQIHALKAGAIADEM